MYYQGQSENVVRMLFDLHLWHDKIVMVKMTTLMQIMHLGWQY